MRKTLSFALAALATVLFISCDKNDGNDNVPDTPGGGGSGETTFVLDASTPEIMEVDWRQDTVVISYTITNPTATGIVSASSDAAWLTFFTQEYGKVTVYVAENLDFDDRSAEMTIAYEGIEYKITVKQVSREWDQEVICPYIQGYYYGESVTPNMDMHSAQFYISDTGWGDTGYDQDPDGHYFQMNLYFHAQPEGTSFVPEGTYTLDGGIGYMVMYTTGSSYFPGTQAATARQLFTSGTCVVSKDGDNYIVDLDVVTEDGLSRHARYTGPAELSILNN